jgi:hypothetical protein
MRETREKAAHLLRRRVVSVMSTVWEGMAVRYAGVPLPRSLSAASPSSLAASSRPSSHWERQRVSTLRDTRRDMQQRRTDGCVRLR